MISKAFENVEWSTLKTCISQIQALRKIGILIFLFLTNFIRLTFFFVAAVGIQVTVGATYFDIDTPNDVHRFIAMADRKENRDKEETENELRPRGISRFQAIKSSARTTEAFKLYK